MCHSTPRHFWNLSNHLVAQSWSPAQCDAARRWNGLKLELRDLPFPQVDPALPSQGIAELANSTLQALLEAGGRAGEPVMVMGELTLSAALAALLARNGFHPLVATSTRHAVETVMPDGSVHKTAHFSFVAFRSYAPPSVADGQLRVLSRTTPADDPLPSE